MTPQLAEDYWVAGGRVPTGPDYMARVLGDFPVSSEDTLIPLHWIDRAKQRWYDKAEDDFIGVSYLGADVARFGGDESANAWRCGRVLKVVDAGKGRDTLKNCEAIREAAKRCDPAISEVRVDSVGLGAGVYDMLRSADLPYRVVGFEAGGAAKDSDQFQNLRSEAWWAVREGFEDDTWILDPEDQELATQLSNIRYKLDSKLRRGIERKQDAKKRGIKSPDRGDAVMMSIADPNAEAPFVWM